MSGIHLRHLNPLEAGFEIANTCQGFLRQLGGPSVLHIKGSRSDQTRVVTTLLHGNEPSGLRAVHRLLKDRFEPYCDTVVIIASVVAAVTEPVFTHRMLPGQRDLNRCFNGPFTDPQGALAAAIRDTVNSLSPTAVVDLHNTSGSGPSFAVSTRHDQSSEALASHFTQRIIFTDITLGSIMEQNFSCPIVTIEAGGAEDDEANVNALLGLRSFLASEGPLDIKRNMETLFKPKRLELCSDTRLCYANTPDPAAHITMCQDIEKHNFGITTEEQALGWLSDGGFGQLKCDDPDIQVGDYFTANGGTLNCKMPLKLFMVTTRADIAKSDCLFYFVEA